MASEPYDLLVIGGGINGLGIAADGAARGLRVRIVERGDWGGGTTSASSRLIHGGLRYLQYGEIDLVRESLRERGLLARQRPHLVHPISLLIPTFLHQSPPRFVIGVGLALYDLLAHDRLFPHPAALTRSATHAREPGLTENGLTGSYSYPDAQVEFPERLCVELMQDVLKMGGEARNHTRVTALLQDGSRVIGARLENELNGQASEVMARLTVNAAGPWLDVVNETLKSPPPKLVGGTWGTHVILPKRDGGPKGPIYATAKRDGRPFFLLPWDGRLLVGTTDVKFTGPNPDALSIESWEIPYLLEETNALFPAARYSESDVQATTVGIRPLPATGDKSSGAITRRHFLVDHAAKHGISGIISVVGGKLTTYRSLAEEAVDQALQMLGRPKMPSRTAEIDAAASPLTALLEQATHDLVKLGLPASHAPRLIALYGLAYTEIVRRIEKDPTLGRPLGPSTPSLEAQVVQAVDTEQALTVDDIVRRRLMLVPATDEAIAGVRRVCEERGLLTSVMAAKP